MSVLRKALTGRSVLREKGQTGMSILRKGQTGMSILRKGQTGMSVLLSQPKCVALHLDLSWLVGLLSSG
jgi:hypothetical protein